jgi:hypothetical protein
MAGCMLRGQVLVHSMAACDNSVSRKNKAGESRKGVRGCLDSRLLDRFFKHNNYMARRL